MYAASFRKAGRIFLLNLMDLGYIFYMRKKYYRGNILRCYLLLKADSINSLLKLIG